jgi:hypothetical protein
MTSPRTKLFIAAATTLLVVGWFLPLKEYITPRSGIGYWLGITGASMMALIFVYSLRKRFNFLAKFFTARQFLNFHIVLGILGPICILYHSLYHGLYHPGATNANIALWSMIIVACSGFIGRYLYLRPGMEKLFNWWHMVHMPIIGMLILSAIAHIISVNVY